MTRTRILTGTITMALVASALGSAACRGGNDDKNAPPTAQIATQSPEQRLNQPMTVEGCLRAGEGGTTFVLTAAQAETGNQPATYHLVAPGDVKLADHVGERVSVTGQLQSQQQASTRTPAAPAATGKPTGTSGTPTVSTATDVMVRRLDVSSLKPLGGRCE